MTERLGYGRHVMGIGVQQFAAMVHDAHMAPPENQVAGPRQPRIGRLDLGLAKCCFLDVGVPRRRDPRRLHGKLNQA